MRGWEGGGVGGVGEVGGGRWVGGWEGVGEMGGESGGPGGGEIGQGGWLTLSLGLLVLQAYKFSIHPDTGRY